MSIFERYYIAIKNSVYLKSLIELSMRHAPLGRIPPNEGCTETRPLSLMHSSLLLRRSYLIGIK